MRRIFWLILDVSSVLRYLIAVVVDCRRGYIGGTSRLRCGAAIVANSERFEILGWMISVHVLQPGETPCENFERFRAHVGDRLFRHIGARSTRDTRLDLTRISQ